MTERYAPTEANLGQPCVFWEASVPDECGYPKFELEGRTTCLGDIDDVCLHVINGRPVTSYISKLLLSGTNIGMPNSKLLPPGQFE